jgi:hypothetical protein
MKRQSPTEAVARNGTEEFDRVNRCRCISEEKYGQRQPDS